MSDVKIGLIGGSGLGDALGQSAGTRHEVDTPFGKPSEPILETTWGGVPIFLLARHGPGHLLNPTEVPYRANIFAMKKLGVTHILASGAVGSLRQELKPRDLVIADQVIDKTSKRPATFYDNAAVHVEFAEPFCPVLRQILIEAGASGLGSGVSGLGEKKDGGTTAQSSPQAPDPRPQTPFTVHERGCYVAMEGPAFSTRAESLMHRLWGGDLIGMTAMPEAKLALEAEISYALIALVTDYDSWKPREVQKEKDPNPPPDAAALLAQIMGNLDAAIDNAVALMKKAVELIAANPDRLSACPAKDALKLAIWSKASKIAKEEVERLAPLWVKYFSTGV